MIGWGWGHGLQLWVVVGGYKQDVCPCMETDQGTYRAAGWNQPESIISMKTREWNDNMGAYVQSKHGTVIRSIQ